MQRILLILLCLPMLGFGQKKYYNNIGNIRCNTEIHDDKLINNLSILLQKEKIGSIPLIVVDSFPSPAGTGILELAFDGEFLWVSGWSWYNIYKMSMSNGSIINSIPTNSMTPSGLTFDGTNLWVCNSDTQQMEKIDINTGNILQTFPTPSTSSTSSPSGLAWNGDLLHNDADGNANPQWNPNASTFSLSPSNGNIIQSYNNPGSPAGLAWDGQYLWTSHNASMGIIQKIEMPSFTIIDSIITPWLFINGLTWDGNFLWAADNGTDMIYKLSIGEGNISGCTDSLACNYNPLANINDNSCNYNSVSYDTITANNSYNWLIYYLTNSGDYTDTLINASGCDSILNLNLTIINTTAIFDTEKNEKSLIKITNLLGKEISHRRHTILFYLYDNGTVEKKITID